MMENEFASPQCCRDEWLLFDVPFGIFRIIVFVVVAVIVLEEWLWLRKNLQMHRSAYANCLCECNQGPGKCMWRPHMDGPMGRMTEN